jgi:ABC-type uncharacterized transport system auxiliary subunit
MTARVPMLGLVAVAVVVVAGCALTRTGPDMRYYTLALPGTPPSGLDGPVRVGTITSDQPYATERIAYRSSPYRLDYYTYHRWAADPRNLVRAAARDYFERLPPASGLPFELEGNIRRLEEVDDNPEWQGAIAIDVRVARAGRVVLERAYGETEPAESKRPEAVAAAVSRALQRILDRVVADVAEREHAAATPGTSADPAIPRPASPPRAITRPASAPPAGAPRESARPLVRMTPAAPGR